MIKYLLIFLLCAPAYGYEPQFTIFGIEQADEINQNFFNIASELQNLNSESAVFQSSITTYGGLYLLNSNVTFSTTSGDYGIIFQDGTSMTSSGVGELAISINSDQFSGDGTLGDPLNLITTTVTLQGNTFNGNEQLVKTDASGNIVSGINLLGNAATVSNGVYITGSYSDPSWITGLGADKLSGTIPAAVLQTEWDTAYGWGNHASGGYADQSDVATDTTTISSLATNNESQLTQVWVDTNTLKSEIDLKVDLTESSTVTINNNLGVYTSSGSFLFEYNDIVLATDTYTQKDLGSIIFRNENNINQDVDYVTIAGSAFDLADGNEDGELNFITQVAGSTGTRIYIDKDGEVGINTLTPSYGLDVNNDFHVGDYQTVFAGTTTFTNKQNFYNVSTFYGNTIMDGLTADTIGANTVNATLYGDGTNISGVMTSAGNNYLTGVNEFSAQTTISAPLFVDEIQLTSGTARIYTGNQDGILLNSRLEVTGYSYTYSPWDRVYLSTAGVDFWYISDDALSQNRLLFDEYGLVLSSGIVAGKTDQFTDGVQIINSDGQIPAISSTYFDDLSGANLTGIPADDSKIDDTGDSVTGEYTITNNTGVYGITMIGTASQNIRLQDTNASASTHKIVEIDFMQGGTAKHTIQGYGDTHATYPKEMIIGGNSAGGGENIRLTTGRGMTYPADLYISSSTGFVGISSTTPTHALSVQGDINYSGTLYTNGVEFAGGGGTTYTAGVFRLDGYGNLINDDIITEDTFFEVINENIQPKSY